MLVTKVFHSILLLAVCIAGSACDQSSPPTPSAPVTEPPAETVGDAATAEEIDEAIAFRLRYGLRADQAYVRAVAIRSDAQAAIPEFGVPLMPDEVDDLMSRRWDPDLLVDVRNYGLLFPEDFGGAFISLKGTGVTIAFKDQLERHRRALSNLVPEGSVVELVRVEWSLNDLETFVERVEAEGPWFTSEGILFQAGADIFENAVDLRFKGPSDATARIEDHFGRPTWLRVNWTGPPPWKGPRATLTIRVTDSDGRPVPKLWCEFTPVDPMVDASGDAVWATDSSGTCVLRSLPVATYRIRLHRWVDNDHYDVHPIKEFRVELAPTGSTIAITIPGP